MNSAKHIFCWMYVNISVRYILRSEIPESQNTPRFSLIHSVNDQFSKVIIKSIYTPTGR